MKGFSSKHIALKVDVIGAENVLFACASVYLSAWKFYRLGSNGVNNEDIYNVSLYGNTVK